MSQAQAVVGTIEHATAQAGNNEARVRNGGIRCLAIEGGCCAH